ncbi:hypothetical protein LPJ56_000948 [Coemansia sp. RSA 2599]|nr:hypothetical protein LPJ75_000262 [Coemansia sp. RSA 2598]KAJ1828685.1 hypothetical protein LPJ56_000948 [Coemansia sp. RSA 2599]
MASPMIAAQIQSEGPAQTTEGIAQQPQSQTQATDSQLGTQAERIEPTAAEQSLQEDAADSLLSDNKNKPVMSPEEKEEVEEEEEPTQEDLVNNCREEIQKLLHGGGCTGKNILTQESMIEILKRLVEEEVPGGAESLYQRVKSEKLLAKAVAAKHQLLDLMDAEKETARQLDEYQKAVTKLTTAKKEIIDRVGVQVRAVEKLCEQMATQAQGIDVSDELKSMQELTAAANSGILKDQLQATPSLSFSFESGFSRNTPYSFRR